MTDQQLWNNFRSGDRASLREIYVLQIDYLIRYGKKFTQDSTLVEDAIHDLFVYLWNKRENLGGTDSIRPYLLSALRRTIIKQINKKNKISSYQGEDYISFFSEPAIDDKITSREEADEKRIKIKKAMENLSLRQKEAIYLKFNQDLSYEDICKVLEISYQSARNLVSGALKKLKKHLELILIIIFFLPK